jgi:hypothetical protein
VALLALGSLDSADKEKGEWRKEKGEWRKEKGERILDAAFDPEHTQRTESWFEVTTDERGRRGHPGHDERDSTPRPQPKSAEAFVISIIRNFS